MAANETDVYQKVADATVTTLAAPGKALAATSITVGSTTNYPTDTGITIAIRVVDSSGELVAGTYTEWVGTVTSGTSLAINGTPVYGSDQVYAAGSTTQVYIGLTKYAHNKLVDGLLVSHDQDGTLKAGAVDNAAALASDVVTTAKILDANVTTAKIAATSITAAKLGQGHAVRVTKSAQASFANGAAITFNTETWKTTTSMHDNATNSSRLIAPIDGYYQVNASVWWLNGETGAERMFALKANGTTVLLTAWTNYNSALFNGTTGADMVRLLATEYVELLNASGASATVRTNSFFDMTFVCGL